MSGVVLPVLLVLFGVELELGLVELLEPEVPLISELLLELELGVVEVLELELEDGEVELMSELLEPVVDDGEVVLLEPVWLEDVEGELCELCAPLPAPLPSLLVELLLCATARPVEKSTAVAIVRSFLLMRVFLLSAG